MMQKNDRLKTWRILYASPLIFGAACGLLALIIAVFAVSNFQREKKLMGIALEQEGTAILSLVSSTSRDQLRRGLMRGEVDRKNWLQSIQQVIENGLEHPRIVSLYLVDQQGKILADGNSSRIGGIVPPDTMTFLAMLKEDGMRQVSRLEKPEKEDREIFQIARIFKPVGARDGIGSPMRDMMRGRMGGRNIPDQFPPPDRQKAIDEMTKTPLFLVAELDLSEFSTAVHKQFIQIIILSFVLLLVGIAGILSLLMMQGLRITQTRLKKMGQFTDVLVSSLPVGLIAMSYDGIIRTCNASACRMLNLSDDTVEGSSVNRVIPSAILARLSLEDRQRPPVMFEIKIPEEPDEQRSLHITLIDMHEADQDHAGKIVLIQDLSQLKKLEAQLQRTERDAAIGRMAAGVAHELRNPLSSIKGLTLLLKSRFKLNNTDRQSAELLVEEVERLNRSIGELLDYARPAQIVLQMIPIDELVKKAVTLVRADADAQEIVIAETYRCSDRNVAIDPDKMIQVILNLCLNGIQAMEDGGRLNVETGCEPDLVTIIISDTGPGIGEEVLPRVFDPYFTTKSGGTGLGLAMSAKIVQDHQGNIAISSQPSGGTTVTVSLPLN